jgi:DNA-binding LytR/AlgR family response regulator
MKLEITNIFASALKIEVSVLLEDLIRITEIIEANLVQIKDIIRFQVTDEMIKVISQGNEREIVHL